MNAPLPLPKYHQIYLLLRQRLEEGEYVTGLPGELVLAERFGVARVTVRRALQQLQTDGLVQRSAGRGTVPTPSAALTAAKPSMPALSGLLENIVSMGFATKVQVLEWATVSAPAPIAQALRLSPGAKVRKVKRLRCTREGPLSLITTYVPAAFAEGLTRRALLSKPMLVLLQEGGVRIGAARQAVSARLADADASQHLGLPAGSALLCVTRLVSDEQGRPVQWLQGLYRPDRFQIEMTLSQVGGIDAKVWVSEDLIAQFQ